MEDLQEKTIINRFDKTNLSNLRKEMNEALKVIRDKYNLSVNVGNVSYNSEGTANFKLDVAVITDNGIVMTTEASNYLNLAEHYGLKPQLGEMFIDNKQRMMVIDGLKPNTKFPVLYHDKKSLKNYKATVAYVNSHFL